MTCLLMVELGCIVIYQSIHRVWRPERARSTETDGVWKNNQFILLFKVYFFMLCSYKQHYFILAIPELFSVEAGFHHIIRSK